MKTAAAICIAFHVDATTKYPQLWPATGVASHTHSSLCACVLKIRTRGAKMG